MAKNGGVCKLLAAILVILGLIIAGSFIGIAIGLLPFFLMFLGWISDQWAYFWVGLITLPLWIWLSMKIQAIKEKDKQKKPLSK